MSEEESVAGEESLPGSSDSEGSIEESSVDSKEGTIEEDLSNFEKKLTEYSNEELEKLARGEALEDSPPLEEESSEAEEPSEETDTSKLEEDSEEEESEKAEDKAAEDEEEKPKQETREQLEARLRQQEEFIQRRNLEIGELRKQLRQTLEEKEREKRKLEEYIQENAEHDPLGAQRAARQIEKIEEDAETAKEAHIATENRIRIEQGLARLQIDPSTITFDEMAECLREDGYGEEAIRQLATNPFGMEANWFISIVQRVRAKQALRILYQRYQEAKAAAVAKQKAQKATVKRIAKAQNSFPSKVNVKTPSGKNVNSLPDSEQEIAELPTEELYKLAKMSR